MSVSAQATELVVDRKLLLQAQNDEPKPRQDPVEISSKPGVLDSPLIAAILVGTMLAAGIIPVILGR